MNWLIVCMGDITVNDSMIIIIKAALSVLKLCGWLAVCLLIIGGVIAQGALGVIDVPAHFLARWLSPFPLFRDWSWNHLLSWSQKFNIWHMGDPDETFSSRVGKAMRADAPVLYWRAFNWFLNLFEDDHAAKAVEADEGDDQLLRSR